ncbi:MAG: class I SAM-dependent methyltransferase [Planctomycetota bacterium]
MGDSSRPPLEPHLRCPRCGEELAESESGARCSGCGRVFPSACGGFDLRPGAGDSNKAYQAGVYDAMAGESTRFDHPHNLTLLRQRALLQRVILTAGSRVLELGGHRSGLFLWLEEQRGIVGTGIDISEQWVHFQNQDARARRSPSRWHLADAEALPFAEASFQAVVSFDVFEHLSDMGAAVRECFRVLKPGGSLVTHVPVRDVGASLDGLQRALAPKRWRRRQEAVGHFHERMLSRPEVAALLRETGFEQTRLQRFNVWVQPLHDHLLLPFLGRIRHRLGAPHSAQAAPPAPGPPRASGFQKLYSRTVLPVARFFALPDLLGRALDIGGSICFVARKPGGNPPGPPRTVPAATRRSPSRAKELPPGRAG